MQWRHRLCRRSSAVSAAQAAHSLDRSTSSSTATARRGIARCIHSQQLVRDALQEVRQQLQNSTPNDAKPLLANALQPPLASSNDVFLHLDRQLNTEEAQTLTAFVNRRCSGEPLAYILGKKEFWSLDFKVTPSTLIPRGDSEVLLETLVEQYPKHCRLRILDIGTGSGCLLLSALSEFPLASGVGLDISCEALQVAQQNADFHGLTDRTEFIQYDMQHLCNLRESHTDAEEFEQLYQQFDVILCNPPYIPMNELHLVARDVLSHEPHLALFSGGPDAVSTSDARHSNDHHAAAQGGEDEDPEGLRMYRYVQQSVESLFHPEEARKKTTLLLEIGSETQARAVRALFSSSSPLTFQRFLIDGQERCRGLLFQSDVHNRAWK